MTDPQNPYHAYADGENPLRLIVALYQGALDATRQAERCLASGDIAGRSKAINKALAILSELLVCLDHEQGGDISQNLKRLYSYMQRRLIEAHARQSAAPIVEVAGLLGTLLDGWRAMDRDFLRTASEAGELESLIAHSPAPAVYGGYHDEPAAYGSGKEHSFF